MLLFQSYIFKVEVSRGEKGASFFFFFFFFIDVENNKNLFRWTSTKGLQKYACFQGLGPGPKVHFIPPSCFRPFYSLLVIKLLYSGFQTRCLSSFLAFSHIVLIHGAKILTIALKINPGDCFLLLLQHCTELLVLIFWATLGLHTEFVCSLNYNPNKSQLKQITTQTKFVKVFVIFDFLETISLNTYFVQWYNK